MRMAELYAVVGVVDTHVEAAVDDAECHRGDAGPLHGEGVLGSYPSVTARLLALAEEPVGAGAHVGDEDLARRRGVHPHLAQRARLLEPLHPALEDERQDLAPLGRGAIVELADEHDDVGVRPVGDERLRPVEDVAVAVGVASRRGAHGAEGIRAGSRLGQRPGADALEGEEVGHPALALRHGATAVDRRGGEADRHGQRRDHAWAVPRQFADEDEHQTRVEARGPRSVTGGGRVAATSLGRVAS